MKAYYAVVYLKNGDACVSSACMSEEECISELKKVCAREFDKIEATTYMVRELQGGWKIHLRASQIKGFDAKQEIH